MARRRPGPSYRVVGLFPTSVNDLAGLESFPTIQSCTGPQAVPGEGLTERKVEEEWRLQKTLRKLKPLGNDAILGDIYYPTSPGMESPWEMSLSLLSFVCGRLHPADC